MEFLSDPKIYCPLIQKTIARLGYAPEHNLDWYHYVAYDQKQEPVFVCWPDGRALLTGKEEKSWYVFSEPLAPMGQGGEIIAEFCEYALNQSDIKKVVLELRTETRQETLKILPAALKARAINYSMTWPVMNMEKFDLALPGGHWKDFRNAKNKFYREHAVSIIEVSQANKEELHRVVDDWRKMRQGRDRAWSQRYYAMIDNDFKGCKTARVMLADGKPIGFNAGWEVPNSDRRWYGGVGIHDYSIRDLGLVLYLEDLEWIKKAGYKTADMAGGEKALTNFKNQFLPEHWYKTFVFSIVKK